MVVTPSRKGISPFIASVILIAFVISIAGIASGWFQGFLKERVSEVEKGSEKSVECTFASISFDSKDVKWAKNESNYFTGDSVNITLRNSGNEKLYNFTVNYVVNKTGYPGNITQNQKTADNPLLPGSQVVLVTEIQNTSSLEGERLNKVRISTLACPNIVRTCDLVEEDCE